MVPGLITAALLLLFVAGCIWLWLPRHARALEEAAKLPLDDEEKTP
ncbi:cbb3-type cytochrome oxidase subunit 3 [Fulvimonas soli]|jgi:cytochrome c oxidase cbb3-type subunit 4|uniref:Cytochrome c oxidase cbb3-type subunit 4 n=1 Tax=Fulvimonas soli TaxID=155197 RepID=A0A316HR00_9GAMM|nr:cbb3-type cytochrome c oxidase subunit 3 [Fulvimonas soli]PWK82379.1 cytochrome c oxidase cbb3-type subunit 4 [Fulvimonas soli]TNY26955.1 cbb3-type cytochrome C oxidase subunit 3 [Fulvimonas soli]